MRKILLVDDEKEFAMVLGERLKEEGFEVFKAFDGKGALEQARKQTPDIILLDIILPDMDGNIVARKLREDLNTRGIPIIFLTGLLSREEARARGTSISGCVFVPKSAKLKELFEEIDRMMGK